MQKAVSDPEIIECAQQELDEADTTLAESFNLALSKFDQSVADGDLGASGARDSFTESQTRWEAFRESACDVVFYLNVGGSARLPETILCMAGYSRERNLKIRELVDQ